MPLYSYTALTEAGVRVTGEGVAASAQELTQELTGKGLLIQQIRKRRAGLKPTHRERVKPEEFLLFNQEFMVSMANYKSSRDRRMKQSAAA